MYPYHIGFALCGSFCTLDTVLKELARFAENFASVTPILSPSVFETDTRFGTAESFRTRMEAICGKECIHTRKAAEPIGPKQLFDALVIAPCTGNTLAKLANGIADTSVTLAAKAHLRNEKPIVVAVSSNDALAGNAESIGKLLNRRHYYFVPMRQDDPEKKPRSVVADFSRLEETILAAVDSKQIQPIFL